MAYSRFILFLNILALSLYPSINPSDSYVSTKKRMCMHPSPNHLHRAIQDNDNKSVQELAKDRWLRNSQGGENCRTPLQMAVITENIDAVKILLNNEAKVDIKDSNGNTAIDLALIKHSSETLKAFIKHDNEKKLNLHPLLTQVNEKGNTPLFRMIKQGKQDLTENLRLSLGHLQEKLSKQDFVQYLHHECENKKTVLTAALEKEEREVFWILIMNGARNYNYHENKIEDKSLKAFIHYIKQFSKVPEYTGEDITCNFKHCKNVYKNNDLLVYFPLCERSFHVHCHKKCTLKKQTETRIDPYVICIDQNIQRFYLYKDTVIDHKNLNYCPGCKEIHKTSDLVVYKEKHPQ